MLSQVPKSSSKRRSSVTFVEDVIDTSPEEEELQVERSTAPLQGKALASMAGSGWPSPFQQVADNQQPAHSPFARTSLPEKGQQKGNPPRQFDSQISIWPWRRHIRRPPRQSESSLNLSCPQLDLPLGNTEAAAAAPTVKQKSAPNPTFFGSGRRPSQSEQAAVEGSAQPPPSPFRQLVSADQQCVSAGQQGRRQHEQAAVEDSEQALPVHIQHESEQRGRSSAGPEAHRRSVQLLSSKQTAQADGSLGGAEAQKGALHRQPRAPLKKCMSFSASGPRLPGRFASHDGVQPMLGRSSAFPLRHLDGGSFSGQHSTTDAAKNGRRPNPRLATVMSWKVAKASSNQGLGPVEAEQGPLVCQRSSTSHASTHYQPLSTQSSLDPSFSENAASQGFMVGGFSEESLVSQVRSHPSS